MTIPRRKIILATILLVVASVAAMFHFRSKPQTAAALCGGSLYTLSYSGGTPHIDIEIGGAPARAMLDYGATKSSLRAKAPADIGHIVKVETSLPLDGELAVSYGAIPIRIRTRSSAPIFSGVSPWRSMRAQRRFQPGPARLHA